MYKHFFKRLFDIIGSILIMPFVIVVIIFAAPFIYFTDKGPIFYNAPRVGKNFREFKMFKLRSMYVNSPDLRNADGSTYNCADDKRVTPFGRFMRKTSLDEFPQFINVLIGDMSLVGPRPILPAKDYSDFTDFMIKRTLIRPGITGYSQAYYRNSISRMDKYLNDAYYADHISFVFDVKILIKTCFSVVKHSGINTNENGTK